MFANFLMKASLKNQYLSCWKLVVAWIKSNIIKKIAMDSIRFAIIITVLEGLDCYLVCLDGWS